MESSVTVKSARDYTCLTFSDVAGETFTAVLESPHFSGRVVVSTYHSGPPDLLFAQMALEWRGWEGTKVWAALEDELRLTAISDLSGHTKLAVVMRNYCDPADWRLQATLELEAGQLAALARAVRATFKGYQKATP